MRNKEHETCLILQEHDDDDDDENAVWLEEHWLVTGRNGRGLYCKPRYTKTVVLEEVEEEEKK